MSLYLALLTQALHIGLILAAAPLLAGVTEVLLARLSGRSGPPLLDPWRDLVRLWRKTPVWQDNLSPVTTLAPVAALGLMLASAALVPSFALGMALSPLADTLVIAALLIAERVTLALAAFDSGAPKPGFAAQDAASLAVIGEPALILFVVALGIMAGGFNLDQIVAQQQDGLLLPAVASAVALTALLGMVLAETSGGTESQQQVFNGPDLALARFAGWLRRLVWLNLIGALFLPIGMSSAEFGPLGWLIGLLAWAAKLFLFSFCLAGVQTAFGRVPRHSLPDLIGVVALLALLAVVIVLASAGAV
ncbi:MAG TPA: NADH-quinone oxidoreductase subunit H [Rhodopila sp.]|nr:NADH-quinone oxidoreductase subunit H [Rhodopila sp.]